MSGTTDAPPPDLRAAGRVVLAALGFAFISIFTVLGTRAGATLSMVLLGRYVVATLALLPALRTLPRPVDGGALLRLLVFGGIGQAVVSVLSLSALAFIPAATLVFLFYTFPAWVTLIAAVRGTERVDRRTLLALGMAFAGLVLLVGLPGGGALHPRGVLLALGAAFAYAIFIPVMGHLQRGVDPALSTLLTATGVLAIFSVAVPLRGEFTLALEPRAWAAMVGVGLFSTAIAFRLFLSGLQALGPVRTSIVCTVEPLFATLLAALLLDQPITLPVVAGGGCILAAVVSLQVRPATRPG